MSAEPRQTTIADAWTKWQGQIVQGRFVLRRCLGWSDQGAVFLTEHKAKNLAEAAIKFVRADAPQAQPLLVRWQAAVNLSHPHLVQLFEVGRWQTEGQDYLFVVMEYGDQTLAEILRRRPLSAEEVQELLPPVLDALTFLHRRQLVHSRLQPSNFLAVGDQLKLTCDSIRPAGQDHGTSSAGDVWRLGATLLEALTARARISIEQGFDPASLPGGLPATLLNTVQRCLSPSPEERPSVIELRAEYKLATPAVPGAKPEPQGQKVSQVVAPPPPANAAPQVAAPAQAVPSVPREALQPVQTASRVTVSFHAVSNNSPAGAQAQPAPGSSQGIAQPQSAQGIARPQAASTASRVGASPQAGTSAAQAAASAQPAPSTSRVVAPTQAANAASPAAASSQSIPSAPRQAAPAQSANIAARAAAPVQPAPNAPREITPPPAENRPSRGTASSQSAASAPREVAPLQPANVAPQVAAPAQPAPNTSRAVTPAQAANTASPAAASSQSIPSAPRQTDPAKSANIAARVAAPVQPAPNAPREITPPPAENRPSRGAASSQSAASAPRAVAPPQPANIFPRVAAPVQAAPSTPRIIVPPRPASNGSQETASSESAPKRHLLGIAAGALLLAVAVWIGLRSTGDSPAPLQPAAIPAPVTPPAPAKVAESRPTLTVPVSPPPEPTASPSETSSSVLNEVLPTVPEKIQSEIQGRIYVTVRALVDPTGNVIGVLMENAGPSQYFARLSENAARQWQFVPADIDAARVWLLRFEYTSDGVAVRTIEQ